MKFDMQLIRAGGGGSADAAGGQLSDDAGGQELLP